MLSIEMRFVYLQTLLGLILSGSGIQAIYVFIAGLDKGTSILILLLAFILIGVGGYLLMKAGKSDETVFARMKNFSKKKINENVAIEKILEKNNELTQKWDKTIEERDKLKMLEVSTAAEVQATNQ